nr:MAG TPA: hypothetical protein [Caudoviricetes sp.]
MDLSILLLIKQKPYSLFLNYTGIPTCRQCAVTRTLVLSKISMLLDDPLYHFVFSY